MPLRELIPPQLNYRQRKGQTVRDMNTEIRDWRLVIRPLVPIQKQSRKMLTL